MQGSMSNSDKYFQPNNKMLSIELSFTDKITLIFEIIIIRLILKYS